MCQWSSFRARYVQEPDNESITDVRNDENKVKFWKTSVNTKYKVKMPTISQGRQSDRRNLGDENTKVMVGSPRWGASVDTRTYLAAPARGKSDHYSMY